MEDKGLRKNLDTKINPTGEMMHEENFEQVN